MSFKRNGVPTDDVRGRGGRRGRLGNFLQLLNADVLTQDGFLENAEVMGPTQLGSTEAVEILIRPKIPRIQVDEGRLWVDAASGMPLRLQLRFGIGVFISSALLKLDLAWNHRREMTVPRIQSIEMTSSGYGRPDGGFGRGGGMRGGMQMEASTTWSDYQWDLTFDESFFKAETRPAPQRRQAQRREDRPEEDPFEEIRINSPGVSNGAMNPETAELDEVLIQGASVRGGSRPGMSESQIIGRLLGAGRWGRLGGLRGARIGFSRANRIQVNVTGGISTSALDAKPYSLDGQETPDPHYLSWETGVTLGGPLPGSSSSSGTPFFGRRRSLFFVNLDINQGEQLQNQYASVPTLPERQGDFSKTVSQSGPLANAPVQIFDPFTGAAYSNARIPSQQLSPVSLALLTFIPLPNREDPFLNFLNQQTLNNSRNRVNARLFSSLSDSLRVSGSYSLNRTDLDSFNVFPDLASRRNGMGQNASVSFNQTFRPGLLHNVRLRWNRNRNETLNPFAYERDISGELGISNTSPAAIDYGLPTLEFTNYTSLRDGSSSLNIREKNTLSDNLQWVKGRHFFRIGGEVSWNRLNQLANPDGAGSQTFAGIATSLYRNDQPLAGTGYDFADFLLGFAQSSRIQYGNSDHYLRAREFAFFVNDNWRLNSRITVQWGVRYQLLAPWEERYDRLANLDVGPEFSGAQTVTPGDQGAFFGQFPRALVESDRNNIAPRVALAYRVQSGRWASVLRANYGVFYPNESYRSFASELISQPPFGFAVQETVSGRNFLEIQSAFSPTLTRAAPNTYAVDPRFRLPTVQNWTFSWQQALPRNFFVSIGYAGSRGTGLELLRAPNRVSNGQPRIEDAAQFLFLTPGASSAFHGLQLLATRRRRSGFSISGQYEFGKSLDNASSIAGSARIVAQNDDDLDSERGRSNFDERHKLRLNWFWELPFGERHRWVRNPGLRSTLLSNWFVTGATAVTSGRPLTARILGNQINNSRTASQASERASVTGEPVDLPSSQRSSQQWFNTTAFRLPDPGIFGNAGRNTISGPGSWTVDLNLVRSIPLKAEGQRLLITLSASNLLNHINYTGLNTVVNSRGFGQVVSVGGTRRIRINLRFMF